MTSPDLQHAIRLACRLEAAAPKPGNVHPGRAFADTSYRDFLRSADAVAPILADAGGRGVGQAVYDAVAATRQAVGRNTNLGIVLLLAPLAAVPRDRSLPQGLPAVLAGLTRADADLVYQAIRLANPGGLGEAAEQDVAQPPTVTLREAMRLAAPRDAVAAEYAGGFTRTLKTGVPLLASTDDFAGRWSEAVVRLHLTFMAQTPDTLIARKCGPAMAEQSARRAQAVLDAGWPHTAAARDKLRELDQWLREDGHRRNPGATADLVCASLFAALRDNHIKPPTGC